MIAHILRFLIVHFTVCACCRTRNVRESMLSTLFCAADVEPPDVNKTVTNGGRFALLRAFLAFASDPTGISDFLYLQTASACQDAVNVALGFARMDAPTYVEELRRGATKKEAEEVSMIDLKTWQAIEMAVLNCCTGETETDLPLLHDRKYPHLAYRPAVELLEHIRNILDAAGVESSVTVHDVAPVMTRSKARRVRQALVQARRTMWVTDELRDEAIQSCRDWFDHSSLAETSEPVASELGVPDIKFDLALPKVDPISVSLWNGKRGKAYNKVCDLDPQSAAKWVAEDGEESWRVGYLVDHAGKEHKVTPRRELDMVEFVDPKSGHSLLSVFVGLDDLVIAA